MYMLGRRRTCSRPSRTWICSAVYATSAPSGWGLRLPAARGFLALLTGISAPSQLGELVGNYWAEFQDFNFTGFRVRKWPPGASYQPLSGTVFRRRVGPPPC